MVLITYRYPNKSILQATTTTLTPGGTSGNYKELLTLEVFEEFIYSKLIVFVAVVGVFGNLLNLGVLTKHNSQHHREKMERAVSVGLTILAVTDLFFCLTLLPHAWLPRKVFFHLSQGFEFYYAVHSNIIFNVTVMVSTWLTVAMATSRYIAICHPLRARLVIDMRYTSLTAIAILISSVLANIPRLWTYKISSLPCTNNNTAYYTVPGLLTQQYAYYYPVYLGLYFILSTVIPLVMLTTCNIYLVRALKKSDRLRRLRAPNTAACASESSRRLTIILIGLVIMYITLVSPAEIINFIRDIILSTNGKQNTPLYNLAVAVVNFLQALNFALNFVLYCSVNSQFRKTITQLMCLAQNQAPVSVKQFDTVLIAGTDRSNNTTSTTLLNNYGTVTPLMKNRQLTEDTNV